MPAIVQLATGQLGGPPSIEGQQLNAVISSQSLLTSVEEFERIVLRVNENGGSVTLSDVSRIEIGAENYRVIGRYNGNPASGIAIELAPGANALETIAAVKQRVKDFDAIIPDALEVVYPIDISPFVKASIEEVIKTLFIAIVLVVVVIYIFLQTARATLIPSVAISVVILGTFALLYAFGFSINVLTLFALVLAIGMPVDDAIVVTENIENKLEEDADLTPKKAAKQAMKEISGALVGTTAVIWAVFVPILFFDGSVGVIYRQFAVTISIALAAKNAILIIEFAKANFDNGMSAYEAAVKAAKQRIRPILMTSLTFILGVMPLAFATGPGSGAQNAISIGVLGGLTSATIFVLFFAPFFFIVVMKLFGRKEQ